LFSQAPQCAQSFAISLLAQVSPVTAKVCVRDNRTEQTRRSATEIVPVTELPYLSLKPVIRDNYKITDDSRLNGKSAMH
jgi:hypothetical protein